MVLLHSHVDLTCRASVCSVRRVELTAIGAVVVLYTCYFRA